MEALPPLTTIAPISSRILADAFGMIQDKGHRVTAVHMNPVDYADMLKLGPGHISEGLTKAETSKMLETGEWPKPLWGATVKKDAGEFAGQVMVVSSDLIVVIEVTR